jgi:hypothetical protein
VKPDFQKCVLAITESLLAARPGADKSLTPPALDFATQLILARHSDLPDHLRLPFRIVTLLFDVAPIFYRGRPFHALPANARAQIVHSWQGSRLVSKQDFIRFFDTLGTLAFYYSFADESDSAPRAPEGSAP